jgi:3-dehydrosphinganine reductase
MASQLKSFEGKTVLITGGSSGIGLALAQLLAQSGARLWLLARRESELASANKQLFNPADHHTIAADVSDRKQVESAIKKIEGENGVPDLVINSAGVTHPGYVQDIPIEIFHEMIEINYLGTVHIVKAVLQGMIARRSGRIVNICSSSGFIGVYGYTAYGASKYAVRGFSDVLRSELKPLGIGVSIVFPPDTDTPQLAYENKFKPFETKQLTGTANVLSPQVVAREILRGLQRGRYVIIPGLENKVIYHLIRLFGDGVYPILDAMIASARRSSQSKKSKLPS